MKINFLMAFAAVMIAIAPIAVQAQEASPGIDANIGSDVSGDVDVDGAEMTAEEEASAVGGSWGLVLRGGAWLIVQCVKSSDCRNAVVQFAGNSRDKVKQKACQMGIRRYC